MKNLSFKWLLMPLVLITFSVGNAQAVTINFGSTEGYWDAHTDDSFTDSDSRSWSRTYSAGGKHSGGTDYAQFGNSSNTCTSLVLTATAGSAITLTSFSVSMEGSSASTAGTIYLYKRTSGGTETQLGTATVSGTTSSTCSMSSNTSFAATDILKVSYVGTAKAIRITTMSYTYTTGGGTTYTVSYAAGTGGSGTNPGAHTGVSSGSSITLKANTFTAPTGKQFAGWNDGSNTYAAGASYTVTGNKTMTAQWECIEPTISGQPASANYTVGDSPSGLSVTASLSSGTMTYLWKVSTNGGSTWSNASGTNNAATYAAANISTAAAGTTKYKCIVTNSTASCSTESDVATITVSEPATPATVTLENYSGSDPTGLHVGDSYTLPSSNSFSCGTKTFVGWSTVEIDNSAGKPGSNYYEPGGSVTISSASMTIYAVFATGTPGTPTPHAGPSFSRSGSTNTITSGYTFDATATADNSGFYKDASSGVGYVRLRHTTTNIFSSKPSRVVLSARIGGGSARNPLGNNVMAQLVDKSGNGLGNATTVTTKVTTTTGDDYNIDMDLTDITSAAGVKLYHTKETSYNVRYYSFSLTYYTGGETTYSNYTTSCTVAPTATFSNGTYTIGGSALDLRTLWESESSGAVTYSITNANGTGATLAGDGYSLSATTAGSCTVQASQAASGIYTAITKTATITVQNPTCATPTFNNGTGTYNNDVTVTISCATGSSTIHYTTGASPADPTCSSGSTGTSVTINATGTTLKAVACKDGYNVSAVASATYTLKCATPTISVAAGTYSSAQSVTLACTTDGATIKYTTDGRDPATYGTTYSSAITISDDATLKVVATKTNYDNSDLASATYKIMDCDWYESFDTNDGTDGCSGTNAGASFKSDHDGWSATYKYGGAGYARFGKSSTASAATTPTITGLTGDLTLKFRARAWDSEGGSMSLSVSDGTLSSSSVTITSCEWDDYNVTISGVTEDFTITFQGPTRYFLDEVCVKGPSSFTVTFDANGHGTAPDPITDVAKNSTISKPTPDPSATGWTFGGWYKEPACTNAWTWATDQVTSNTTLYAKWTCVAPTTATVSATGSKWDYCAGESMTLTAGGTGIGDGATYLWKVSHDGGSSYSNAPGTNNASTYSVASMTLAHGGKYTCTICNGSCSTTSSAYDVKVWCVHINNGAAGAYQDIAFTNTGTGTGTANVALDADQSYGFKLWNNNGASIGWYGLDSKTITTTESNITLNSSGANVGINAGLGGTYVFTIDYTSATSPKVSVTYPVGNQPSGRKIWFDKSVITGWTDAGTSDLVWRIGKKANSMTNQDATANYFTLVPGTDRFYEYTTKEYNGFEAWHVANNVAWSGNSDNNPDYDNHSIYTHYHNQNSTDVKYATVYQKYVIGTSGVTLVPTTKKNTDWYCDFWNVTKYDGMLTHTATITPPTNGTITIANAAQSLEETTTTADLPHRTILTVTATPAPGYQLSSLTVNGEAFTSGNEHILSADATIAATFTAKTITITWNENGGNTPSPTESSYTYNGSTVSLATVTHATKLFAGWWTDPSAGTQITEIGTTNKPTADVTYYAHWVDGNTVYFHPGVGSVTPTSVTQTSIGGAVDIPTPTIDCDGWSFAGWNIGSELAETTTNPEASLQAAGSAAYVPASTTVHMYAVWKKNFGGGTGTIANTYNWDDTNNTWSTNSMSAWVGDSNTSPHSGTKCGNNSSGGAYIYCLTKPTTPDSLVFYYTKSSTNTTSSNKWCIQTSSNGSTWTTQEYSKDNSQLTRGTWEKYKFVMKDTYSNVYVRLLWSNGSSASGGTLDDVTFYYEGTIPDAWKWTSSADDYGCVSANQVKTPVISPNTEAQTGDVSVTITCATAGATIRYTTDGTDPTSSSGTVYSGAFTVSCSATVKAIAYKATMDDSEIASQAYTITVPTPTFSLAEGTYYDANQSVTLSLPTAHTGTVIKYTTNGDDPTSSSATYSSAITVTEGTTTIKAIGYNSTCGTSSSVASATYIVRFGTDYTLVTDANDLMAGDQLVIISADAGTSSKYAISTTISANKRTSTNDYNINAGLTTAKIYPAVGAAATVQVFTLGGEPGAWTFHETTNDGYLNCPSAGKLTNTANVSNSNKWTIAIASNIATIHNNEVDATIKSNTGSNHVFAAYGPLTENVQLVKLYSIPNPDPVIKIDADLSAFSACHGSASDYQSFYISGKNLDGSIVLSNVAPLAGYEFCRTSGGTYTATLELTPVSKTVAKTQVFVRLAAGATAGTKNGNLNAAVSANSLSTNIAVTGSVSVADTYTDQVHNTVVANQCGDYYAPSCPDASSPADESCVETHFKFMGWITEADKNASGVKDDAWYIAHLVTAGTAMTADGTNYYAVWAKEED